MKHYDYLVDVRTDERVKRLKDYQKLKSTAPDSYKSNTTKEVKCVELLAAYSDQYLAVFKNRHAPFVTAENEYGIKKCVCSAIRPTTLPEADLTNLKEIGNFVANFVKHLPLSAPAEYPKHLFSPSSVLDAGLGDSFEISTLICSLLLGVGYDAYVVCGVAPSNIVRIEGTETSASQGNVPTELVSNIVEDLPAFCTHSWVFVSAAGGGDITENCFVDPFTGQVMSTKLCPYTAIDAIWNHSNYWLNTHFDKPVTKVSHMSYPLTLLLNVADQI